MTRRGPTLALLLFCLAAPALAQGGNPVEEGLIASLQAQGYEVVEHGYTWLGRLRIVAQNGELRRELVVNPGTGEVLRDYAERLDLPKPGGTPTQGVAALGGTLRLDPTEPLGTAAGVASSAVALDGLSVTGSASAGSSAGLVLEPALEPAP